MNGRIQRPHPMRFLLTGLMITAFAITGACASAGGAGGTGDAIMVRVSNNLVPSLTVSISAAVEGTTPVRLGSLVAGAEQTFTYRPTITTGTFRLVADRPGPSGSLVSEPIPLQMDGTTTVEWDLRTNNVVIQ